jgi:hypothetical protein
LCQFVNLGWLSPTGDTVKHMADDDIVGDIERYRRENSPTGITVPTGVSEDQAVRAVQEQFEQAGFGCTEETARELVRETWGTSK